MKLKTILTTAVLALVAGTTAIAAPIDDARRLVDEERYDEAIPALRKIVKSSPRNATANYLLGYALSRSGNPEEGARYLTTAETRGSADAAEYLARQAFDNYDPEAAEEHLEAWETAARKAKKSLPDDYQAMSSRLVAMSNMLQRVEKIEILDTLRVDAANFFTHYRLSPHSGNLAPGKAIVSRPGATVVFVPETRIEMFYAARDSSGASAIYNSAILDDGTMENPRIAELDPSGEASFPFLMPDGMTLYYAADNGSEGLGGYDIYMTRRNDDGSYMQSQNLGMPYNSPFNDYMLAIDETAGLGWWASDREQIPGVVTIYVFAPSETRENYPPDSENLAAMARLSDIGLTRNAETDYKAELEKRLALTQAPASGASGGAGTATFTLDLGNGKVYTSLADFHSTESREAMLRYLADERLLKAKLSELERLRAAWPSDRSTSRDILSLEHDVDTMRPQLINARNNIIRTELRN